MTEAQKPPPAKDPETGRFLPGNNGGPGRPKGARQRFADQFFLDMADAWENGGKQALAEMIAERPHEFVKTAASLQTKEHSGPDGEPLVGLDVSIRR